MGYWTTQGHSRIMYVLFWSLGSRFSSRNDLFPLSPKSKAAGRNSLAQLSSKYATRFMDAYQETERDAGHRGLQDVRHGRKRMALSG